MVLNLLSTEEKSLTSQYMQLKSTISVCKCRLNVFPLSLDTTGSEEYSSSESIKLKLLKRNHAYSVPLKTSFAMHLCKFLTVHCFKTDAIVLFSIVSLRASLF